MLELLEEPIATDAVDFIGAAGHKERVPMGLKQRQPRILLAEDDLEMRRYLAEKLRKAEFQVTEAEHGIRVLDYLATSICAGGGLDTDLVISDVRMPGADGLQLLTALRSYRPDLPVVLITAFGNPQLHEEALLRGAHAVVDKPFDFDDLLEIVRQALPFDSAPDNEG